MDRIPEFLQRHPRWTALLLGLVSATGFQPLHLWPLSLAAMGALIWLLYKQDAGKRVFLLGWLFAVAHFTLTNNWIATAFTYQAEMPAVLGWAAVPLLSLYLAVWPALAGYAAWKLARTRGLAPFSLMFGAFWIAAEWLRSWVFTGYAWGPFSMAMLGDWQHAGLGRVLPYMGTYALSGIAVAICGMLVWCLAGRRWTRDTHHGGAVVGVGGSRQEGDRRSRGGGPAVARTGDPGCVPEARDPQTVASTP